MWGLIGWVCIDKLGLFVESQVEIMMLVKKLKIKTINFFFYLGFLSRTLMNLRTAGEGGGHLFNSSLPFLPTSHIFKL